MDYTRRLLLVAFDVTVKVQEVRPAGVIRVSGIIRCQNRGGRRRVRVFETITMIMQFRDFRRRAKVDRTDVADPYLKKVIAYNSGVTKGSYTRTRRTEKCYAELTYPYSRLP